MQYATALSFWQRLRGVIGKEQDFCPLFIPRCTQVHTFWMKAPIDLFWIDRDGHVCQIERGVVPRRIRSCHQAYGVLETPNRKIKNIKIKQRIMNPFSKSSFSILENSGSVITEFALILPVLILLIFGFLQLSLVIVDKLKLTHSTNYATFVGATTNDNTKITGALASYYNLSDITYTLTSTSATTGGTINHSARRHNDIITLSVKKRFPIQIPLMTLTHIDIETHGSARVVCTKNTAPYVCN